LLITQNFPWGIGRRSALGANRTRRDGGHDVNEPTTVIGRVRRTAIGISARRQPSLLRLDVGRPDHLAPLLGFFGDELAEVCW